MSILLIILAGVSVASIFIKEYLFNTPQLWIEQSKLPNPIKVLLQCHTCLSFWTTLIVALICGQGWYSIICALVGSLVAREITFWEEKE